MIFRFIAILLLIFSGSISLLAQQELIINEAELKSFIVATSKFKIEDPDKVVDILLKYENQISSYLENNNQTGNASAKIVLKAFKEARKKELEAVVSKEEALKITQLFASYVKNKGNILSMEDRNAVVKDLRSYLSKNYFPLVKDLRLQLENELSDDLKNSIVESRKSFLRTNELIAEKERECDLLKNKRIDLIRCKSDLNKVKKQHRTSRDSLLNAFSEISTVNQYLKQLEEKTKGIKMQLKDSLYRVYADLNLENSSFNIDAYFKYSHPLNFLFMDANNLSKLDDDFASYLTVTDLTLYKNSISVTYNLKKDARVVIEVFDKSGDIFARQDEGVVLAGANKFILSELVNSDCYFIQVRINGIQSFYQKAVIAF